MQLNMFLTALYIAPIFQTVLTAYFNLVTSYSCFTKHLLAEMVLPHLEKKSTPIMESASLQFQFHAWWVSYRAICNALLIKKRKEVSKAFLMSHLLFLFVQLIMLKRALARWWHSTDAVIRTRQKNGHKLSSAPASPGRWQAPRELLHLVWMVRLLHCSLQQCSWGLLRTGTPV